MPTGSCPTRDSRRAATLPCRLSQAMTSRRRIYGFRSDAPSGAARKMRPTPPGAAFRLPTASHSLAANGSDGSTAAKSPPARQNRPTPSFHALAIRSG